MSFYLLIINYRIEHVNNKMLSKYLVGYPFWDVLGKHLFKVN